MFMFRKKEKKISTSTDLQKDAKKFQTAISEINTKYKPNQIDYELIKSISQKYGIDSQFVMESFETYLKNNALGAIRRIKASSDYTVWHLEQASLKYGYELDDLQVTFFSKE